MAAPIDLRTILTASSLRRLAKMDQGRPEPLSRRWPAQRDDVFVGFEDPVRSQRPVVGLA